MDKSLRVTADAFSNELKQSATACANLSSTSLVLWKDGKEEIQIGECVKMKPELKDYTLPSVFSCLEPELERNSSSSADTFPPWHFSTIWCSSPSA